jgi:hypothetical protein
MFGWPVGSTRPLPYAILAATVVSALGFYQLFHRLKRHSPTLITGLLTTFLLIPTFFGIMNIYPSPWLLGSNAQVTLADEMAITWLLNNQNEEVLVEDATFSHFELAQALKGWKAMPKNFRPRAVVAENFPVHFGYDKFDSFGASLTEDRYLTLNKRARMLYPEVLSKYPSVWKWTPQDLKRLEVDPTVQRIYHSGEFEIFYIRGIKKSQ